MSAVPAVGAGSAKDASVGEMLLDEYPGSARYARVSSSPSSSSTGVGGRFWGIGPRMLGVRVMRAVGMLVGTSMADDAPDISEMAEMDPARARDRERWGEGLGDRREL